MFNESFLIRLGGISYSHNFILSFFLHFHRPCNYFFSVLFSHFHFIVLRFLRLPLSPFSSSCQYFLIPHLPFFYHPFEDLYNYFFILFFRLSFYRPFSLFCKYLLIRHSVRFFSTFIIIATILFMFCHLSFYRPTSSFTAFIILQVRSVLIPHSVLFSLHFPPFNYLFLYSSSILHFIVLSSLTKTFHSVAARLKVKPTQTAYGGTARSSPLKLIQGR